MRVAFASLPVPGHLNPKAKGWQIRTVTCVDVVDRRSCG